MQENELISIGELAELTGISVDTIRIWERRYGSPVAERLPSGHRRYTQAHVRHLRRIAESLAIGYRPSKVLKMSEQELDELLAPQTPPDPVTPLLARRLESALRFDRQALTEDLENALTAEGVRPFIINHLLPLLDEAGRRWADGSFQIRHEHFLSEIIEDFMRSIRSRVLRSPSASPMLITTLSGERHGVGVQAAAVFASLAGATPRIMGTDLPTSEIVAAVEETGSSILALSVSLSSGGVETDRTLSDLRQRLDSKVALIVGGRGSRGIRRGPRGVEYIEDFAAFEDRIRELVTKERSPQAAEQL